MGGKATKVPNVAYLQHLPHYEDSTLNIPQETIEEWGRLYTQSNETYYVMSRKVEEWIGKTPDTPAPPRVLWGLHAALG